MDTSMRSKFKVVKAVFLLVVVTGLFLNLLQVSKLKDVPSPNQSGRRAQIDPVSRSTIKYKPKGFAKRSMKHANVLVKAGDFVYSEAGWDSSPIVIESHKLVFFTVPKAGCTVWKQLFRRMMGFQDWKTQSSQDDSRQIPHNPKHNGLRYLHQYSLREANEIMTSPKYTRAIFVRDPKERFLSAFLDKALSNDGSHVQAKCCPGGDCVKEAQKFPGFIKLVLNGCSNPHWDSQSRRMEPKYWRHLDFVGHIDNAAADAKKLLQQIGAWDDFGKSGWGANGDKAVFESKATDVSHATWSKYKMWKHYTPELETIVENFFAADYTTPVLNLTRSRLY
ncbi:Carbohydrate sulfotransferase 9 [Seminavis robusta]|uniref:Carbohydrate sulfotransferase 9 n=1 Tax=Seminavis robusta TaxID=568900 RepID=A0A9N8H2P7_9STRA|nr:Carbohydrate sulfotransferase 9 [Seminavis robusta]|eukprot:Sro22_g015360.1 Carbohydrate sulfotransferase 9 (335) ;mRNA; r:86049-87155